MTVRPRDQLATRLGAAAVAAVLLAAVPCGANDLAQTLEHLYDRGGYQREMPVPAAATTPSEPAAPEVPAERPEETAVPRYDDTTIDTAGDMIRIAGYVIGSLIVMAAIYFLIASLTGLRLGRGREDVPVAERAGGEPETETARSDFPMADRLAREGRFGEAIHLLLLGVVAALRDSRKERAGVSATVREIVRRAPLADDVVGALRELAHTSELIHFGGRTAGPERYEQCRSDARAVLAALQAAEP